MPSFGYALVWRESAASDTGLTGNDCLCQFRTVELRTNAAGPSGHWHFESHITAESAALCLIHASNVGRSMGQDQFCNNAHNPNCPAGSPISIDGGSNNPDPGLQGANNISRSDSVVTLPIYCTGAGCTTNPVTIIGFLQLGITQVAQLTVPSPAFPVRGIVMNVIGCGSTSGTNAVSGGGVSPIPVRLVQ